MSLTETTRPTTAVPAPMGDPSAGSQTPALTNPSAAPMVPSSGRGQTSPQAIEEPSPSAAPPAGTKLGRDHDHPISQADDVSATNFPGDPIVFDAHRLSVVGEQDQPTASGPSIPNRPAPSADDHPRTAKVVPHTTRDAPSGGLLHLIDEAVEADPAFLSLIADVVDDLERVRIANENRLRHLTRDAEDSDGEVRGLGLDVRNPHVRRIAGVVDQIKAAEHDAVLALQNLMRRHPLGPWVKATKGVGEKQAARLLGTIGDPYIRPELTRADGTVEPARPRTVSELWAYCGLHVLPAGHSKIDDHCVHASGNQTGSHPNQGESDTQTTSVGVAPKRQKGQRANWSTVAKTRAYLIAESCIKNRQSPFRAVYDDTRSKYADAIHKVPCARCGPSGKPAPAGSPLSDGHKHARAMRAVSKAVLKELWRESKRLHEEAGRG